MPRLATASTPTPWLDRLGWTAGACFEAYGVRIGVRSNVCSLLERLEPHLPPEWSPAPSPEVDQLFSLWSGHAETPGRPSRHRVYAGRERRLRTSDLGQALGVLESEIRLCVAARTAERVFVHAGVVGLGGRAILIPGRSRSGKTTLVAELVRLGALYYSDEFAVLDEAGRVHPFAKALSVREGNCSVHEVVHRRRAEELGGRSGQAPLPVALVVLTAHRPGAEWRARRLTAGEGVLEMLAHTVPARLRPGESLRALEAVAAGAAVYRGERGEAREAAQALLGMLSESDRTSRREAGEEEMR
jgi:hypothetical protein